MEIRTAKQEDFKSIITVMKIANNRDNDWSNPRVKKYTSSDSYKIFVAVENKEIIGYLGIKSLYDDELIKKRFRDKLEKFSQVTWIGVLPEHRRHGVAKALLLSAEKWSSENGKQGYWLECSERLLPFYKHLEMIENKYQDEKKRTRYVMVKS